MIPQPKGAAAIRHGRLRIRGIHPPIAQTTPELGGYNFGTAEVSPSNARNTRSAAKVGVICPWRS
ncbi:hypothetical protein CCHOA_05940 [Corynebacterium choanae]|uniref:Uncharacterized protein n=1 Tax=Corynebacterium choanae TaxID=1862358 RepID=A0A3G6J697_9CORY|nr:hypothetical protein CCHOA_05940 [Corynebacterium choanae]